MKWLSYFTVFLIAATLVGGFFIDIDPKEGPGAVIGKISESKGLVMSKDRGQESFTNVKKGHIIRHGQTIVTGIDSSATFDLGSMAEIQPDSRIVFLKNATENQVVIRNGEVRPVGKATQISFYINDRKMEPGAPLINRPPARPVRASAEPKKNDPVSLELHKTFRLHQRFVEKCFFKHYDRVSGNTQSGIITTQFDIKKSGKIINLEIVKSDFSDTDFHDCVGEVISRISLKKGNSKKSVQFPVQISLPL